MRPGRYRPGCRVRPGPRPAASPRFNEAGAISPRMAGARAGARVTKRGFNEAGAISPRMHRVTAPPARSSPRFNEAGAISPRMRTRLPWLSVSRLGFNEAGAISPRMRGRWRHPHGEERHASMRPGRYRPGCTAAHYGMSADDWASMRPGRYRPGCLFGGGGDGGASGRFNEAGAISPRMRRTAQDVALHNVGLQ